MKIGIGIAHYPTKPGACSDDFCEHAESQVWTTILKPNLELAGHEVFIAPVGKLGQKVAAINAAGCDIALEIHFNGAARKNVKGTETLYAPGSRKGKRLAKEIQKLLPAAMGVRDRGTKEGWYKQDAPGVEDYEGDVDGDEVIDYFLRKTNCPAVIIEPDFISQRPNILANRVKGVHAIKDAIVAYDG